MSLTMFKEVFQMATKLSMSHSRDGPSDKSLALTVTRIRSGQPYEDHTCILGNLTALSESLKQEDGNVQRELVPSVMSEKLP